MNAAGAVEEDSMWIQLRKHFAVRSLEWFNSVTLFSWGSYVTLHPGLFTMDDRVTLYQGLLSIMPQQAWGYGATLVALVQLFSLFVNGRWGLTPWIRAATSVLSVGAWFFVSAGIYLAGSNTGLAIYPVLMLAGAYSAFRAASDAAEASFNKKLAAELAKRGLGDAGNVRPFARRSGSGN
jgi:hypothetical protein